MVKNKLYFLKMIFHIYLSLFNEQDELLNQDHYLSRRQHRRG